MERIYTLIDKLYQQKTQAVPASHLLFTVQLLQQELSLLQGRNGSFGSNKVAVTLPVNLNFSEESLRTPFSEAAKEKELFVLDPVDDAIEDEEIMYPQPDIDPKEYILQKPAVKETFYEPKVKIEEPRPVYAQQQIFNSAFDTVTEVPTLSQYERKELHHVIGEKKESLNDRLKEERAEVAHVIKESPIKDLRKGIGINDRFVFVKELFRGDDAMYERSIKTINAFNIYSEAEYWIARELKHKLGWNDSNDTVKHFYQLVRRRFS